MMGRVVTRHRGITISGTARFGFPYGNDGETGAEETFCAVSRGRHQHARAEEGRGSVWVCAGGENGDGNDRSRSQLYYQNNGLGIEAGCCKSGRCTAYAFDIV